MMKNAFKLLTPNTALSPVLQVSFFNILKKHKFHIIEIVIGRKNWWVFPDSFDSQDGQR